MGEVLRDSLRISVLPNIPTDLLGRVLFHRPDCQRLGEVFEKKQWQNFQSFAFQAEEVRAAIYDCNWYSAPIPFQKLVLNMLTRTMTETKFEAYPLFDLNFELLARVKFEQFLAMIMFHNKLFFQVVKRTYSLIAVLRKSI